MREKPAPSVRNPEDLFQRDARRVISDINVNPLLRGVLAERVELKTVATRVPHSLGRPPKGFLVVDSTTNVSVWRDTSQAATPTHIPLLASTTATVSLWIF